MNKLLYSAQIDLPIVSTTDYSFIIESDTPDQLFMSL